MVHPVQLGKNQRMSYSQIDEVLEMPNLIEVQKNSYNWFLEEGLREVFRDISPISDYTGNLILEFIDYRENAVFKEVDDGKANALEPSGDGAEEHLEVIPKCLEFTQL